MRKTTHTVPAKKTTTKLVAVCHCERYTAEIPPADVVAGRTFSCGSPTCGSGNRGEITRPKERTPE